MDERKRKTNVLSLALSLAKELLMKLAVDFYSSRN